MPARSTIVLAAVLLSFGCKPRPLAKTYEGGRWGATTITVFDDGSLVMQRKERSFARGAEPTVFERQLSPGELDAVREAVARAGGSDTTPITGMVRTSDTFRGVSYRAGSSMASVDLDTTTVEAEILRRLVDLLAVPAPEPMARLEVKLRWEERGLREYALLTSRDREVAFPQVPDARREEAQGAEPGREEIRRLVLPRAAHLLPVGTNARIDLEVGPGGLVVSCKANGRPFRCSDVRITTFEGSAQFHFTGDEVLAAGK